MLRIVWTRRPDWCTDASQSADQSRLYCQQDDPGCHAEQWHPSVGGAQVSKITVYEHLNQLVKKGAVRRDKARARAVSILYDPDLPTEASGAGATLRLAGTIAAGQPIEAIEDTEEMRVDELIPHGDGYYLLRVRGKSMVPYRHPAQRHQL